MIVDNRIGFPYTACKQADIRPNTTRDFVGWFEKRGETFNIKISHESFGDGSDFRALASITMVDSVPKNMIDEYACNVALQSQDDVAFAPVTVDLRDGETAYRQTWVRQYPDDDEMDAFIRGAKLFIESHLDELRSMSKLDEPLDVSPLLELLSGAIA